MQEKQIAEQKRVIQARQQILLNENLHESQKKQEAKQINEPERDGQAKKNNMIEAQNTTIASTNDFYCRLTQDSGTCTNYRDLWYYDYFSGKCLKFIYSGCGGNLNRFRSEEECKRRCGHLKAG